MVIATSVLKVESTLVITNLVEFTWRVYDTLEDVFDDEKMVDNQCKSNLSHWGFPQSGVHLGRHNLGGVHLEGLGHI